VKKIASILIAAALVLCLSPPIAYAAGETDAKTELIFVYAPSSPTYTVTVDGTWKKGTDTGLTVTTNGDSSKFTGVKVDGVLIDPSNFTLSGSLIITLKPEYLETLSVGEHRIEIMFADGSVQTVFVILAAGGTTDPPDPKDPDKPPITGDNSNPTLWLLLGSASLAVLNGMFIVGRKRKRYSASNQL